MKKILAILLVLVMILGVVSGCGVKNETSEPTPSQNNSGNQQPSSSGNESKEPEKQVRDTVNVSINMAWSSSDPIATQNLQDRVIWWQMFEGLLFWNELTGTIDPDIASSYDVSDDGLEYTFHLRDDIYFHNGEKCTADDVVFSFERAASPESLAKQYCVNIAKVEALDPSTVKVTLSSPYAPFLLNCCYIFILNKKEVEEQGAEFGTKVHGAGTGPYKLIYMENDTKITLEAFDKYYKGVAPIKYVNFYPITDSAAGMVSFESGNLDWYICSIMDAQRIQMEDKFDVEIMPANHITYYSVNPQTKNKALQNEKVRQAMAYAVDKEEMNMAAFEGLATEAKYFYEPEWNVGAPAGDYYDYDPEKAKALLAEAGYPDGCDVGELLCFKGSHFEVCATMLQAQWERVGIHAELVWMEQSTMNATVKARDYNIGCTGFTCQGDYGDYRQRFHSSNNARMIDYTGTEYDPAYVDRMFDESAACSDPAKRLEMTMELHNYIMKTACQIPLLHKAVAFAKNKDLKVVNRPTNPIIYDWHWE